MITKPEDIPKAMLEECSNNMGEPSPVNRAMLMSDDYTDSPLVEYTCISPNCNSPRDHEIDTITIHCMGGQASVETCGWLFSDPDRCASSNYGVGPDGRIALYVHESDRSWCTSSYANDRRAVTIEVASDDFHPYAVTQKAYESTIKLVADICKRNGIKKLLWKADPSLKGQIKLQNMTAHRWYDNKACPGDYLYTRFFDIAERVNKILEDDVDMTKQEVEKLIVETVKELTPAIVKKTVEQMDKERAERPAATWAQPAIDYVTKEGIMKDVSEGGKPEIERPYDYLTRQELAQTFYNQKEEKA